MDTVLMFMAAEAGQRNTELNRIRKQMEKVK